MPVAHVFERAERVPSDVQFRRGLGTMYGTRVGQVRKWVLSEVERVRPLSKGLWKLGKGGELVDQSLSIGDDTYAYVSE